MRHQTTLQFQNAEIDFMHHVYEIWEMSGQNIILSFSLPPPLFPSPPSLSPPPPTLSHPPSQITLPIESGGEVSVIEGSVRDAVPLTVWGAVPSPVRRHATEAVLGLCWGKFSTQDIRSNVWLQQHQQQL